MKRHKVKAKNDFSKFNNDSVASATEALGICTIRDLASKDNFDEQINSFGR